MASIELLPAELLYLILSHLDLSVPPTSSRAELSEDYRARRSALRNLCLASQWGRRIAQPLLFHSVFLIDGAEVVFLTRALLENSSLRNLICNLACLVDLADDGQNSNAKSVCLNRPGLIRCIALSCQPELSAVEQKWVARLGIGFANMLTLNIAPDNQNLGRFVGLILFLATNLGDIFLRVSASENIFWNSQKIYGPVRQVFSGIYARRPRNDQRPVTSIRLQCDPDKTYANDGTRYDPDHFSSTILPTLKVPSATHVELFGDDGDWCSLLNAHTPKRTSDQLSTVEHLSLLESKTAPILVYQILRHCKNLRSLKWTFRLGDWNMLPAEHHFMSLVGRTRVNDAVTMASKSLERLTIETVEGHIGEFQHYLDRSMRVSCLPSFENLQHLTIGLFHLMEIHHEGEPARGPRDIADQLPHGLKSFVLTQRWHSELPFEPIPSHMADANDKLLDEIFQGLYDDCPRKLPRLHELAYRAYRIPAATKYCLSFFKGSKFEHDENIEKLKTSFRSINIGFEWQWRTPLSTSWP
ncbi:hypothetical protein SCUP234_07028 [Seiridium cupressi]